MLCEFKDINYTICAESYDVLAQNLLIFGIWFFVCHIILHMFCQALSMARLGLDYTDNVDTALRVEP